MHEGGEGGCAKAPSRHAVGGLPVPPPCPTRGPATVAAPITALVAAMVTATIAVAHLHLGGRPLLLRRLLAKGVANL